MKMRVLATVVIVTLAVAGFGVTRMLQSTDPDVRLVLNIPASRLDVYESGKRTHSFEVSAGKRGHETPAGRYGVREIIWNPWWHPPKSEWARNEKPAPPGRYNPMGRIKLNFADLLYIHGTQWEDHLGAPVSHGCIRMGDEDLVELTELLHRYRTPKVDPTLIAKLKNNREITRSFPIRPVRFEVVYQLVEVLDGKLIIHPDVYRTAGEDLRKEIVTTLKKSGYQVTSRFDAELDRLSKTRKVTRLTVSIDSLFSGAAGD